MLLAGFNTSTGNFQVTTPATENYSAGTGSSSVHCTLVAADLNHDGVLDLAVVNSASSQVAVLYGTDNSAGTGVWFGSPSYWTISGSPAPGEIAAADFYGQANPDLGVADSSGGSGANALTVLSNGGGTPATTNSRWWSWLVERSRSG